MSLNKASWRRPARAFIFALCGFLSTTFTTNSLAQSADYTNLAIRQANSTMILVAAKNKAVVEFDFSVKDVLNQAKANSDLAQLGLTPTGELGTVFELIVEGDFKSVEKSVQSKSASIKSKVTVKPLYYMDGRVHQKTAITLKSRLVVKFKDTLSLDDQAEFEKKYGLIPFRVLTDKMIEYSVDEFSSEVPDLAAKIWSAKSNEVEFVEPVFSSYYELHSSTALSPGEVDDPLRFLAWHQNNDGRQDISRGTSFDEDHDVWRAWNPNTRNSSAFGSIGDGRSLGYFGRPTSVNNVLDGVITVAVFDSGNDLAHEDWVRNITDVDPDPGGFSVIDPRTGTFDRIDLDPDPTHNGDSHGTSVAGIIASARNNGTGGSGIAPDVRLLNYRVVEAGASATSSDIAAAVIDASARLLADVGNHSYGGLGQADVLREAFNFAFSSGRFNLGMPNFVSSGNDTTFMSFPALHSATFSVGGFDRGGNKTGYASWGGKLDFVGATSQFATTGLSPLLQIKDTEGILTNDISGNGGRISPNSDDLLVTDGNYTGIFNGTSAASPVVAGVAALLLAENTSLTVTELFNQMANTSDKIDDPALYVGRENQANRFQFLNTMVFQGDPGEPDLVTTTPTVVKYGRPNNFRGNNFQITADGWSPFYGYGRPNPYNQITQQIANIGPRDYILLDSDGPEADDEPFFLGTNEEAIDAGDLVLIYTTGFETDYNVLIQSCISLLQEGDPEADVDPEELAECVRNDNVNVSPWLFSQGRLAPNGDDPGILEVGYEDAVEMYGSFQFEFDYAIENTPNQDNIPFNNIGPEDSFTVLLTSSRATRPDEEVAEGNETTVGIIATDGDDFYNPRGRYLSGTTIQIANDPGSISLPVPEPEDTDLPFVFDITLRHEFGIENTSGFGVPFGRIRTSVPEIDMLQVSYNGVVIGYIYGNSDNLPVFPLPVPEDDPDAIVVDDIFFFPNYTNSLFEPERGIENMPFRTYRFPIPASARSFDTIVGEDDEVIITGEEPTISLNMVSVSTDFFFGRGFGNGVSSGTGAGTIAEIIRDENNIPTDQFTVPGANRDFPGYEIAQMKIWKIDTNEDPSTGLTGREILEDEVILIADNGTEPDWSVDGDEIFYVDGNDTGGFRNEVRTALSDGLFTALSIGFDPEEGGRTFDAFVQRRNNVLLLESTSENPEAASPAITAFDVDENSNRIAYVIDDPLAIERVFISTDDGFDEKALFPASNGISRDLDVRDIEFGRVSDEIIIATDTDIFSTDDTGLPRDSIIDIVGSKLQNFDDITIARQDSLIIFSAENTSGDRGIYATIRNINIPDTPGLVFEIIDWPNSDEVQPSLHPNGKLLAFASNTVDQDGGTTPDPTRLNQIYLASDINNFLDFATPILFSNAQLLQRDLRTSSGLSETYDGGQYPKFSGNSSSFILLFEGLDIGTGAFGEIATSTIQQPGSAPITIPTQFPQPDPGITPPPVADAEEDDQIIQTSRSDFDFQADGWSFEVGTQFGIPFQQPLSSKAGGALTLVSFNNNINTFGLFESLNRFVRLTQPVVVLDQDDLSNHYLVRYYVRRTTADITAAGTFIGRVVSDDGQNVQEVQVNPSTANNPFMPGFDNFTSVDLLFHPNVDIYNQVITEFAYNVFFGLENTDVTNDPNAGFVLDRVDIYRLDPAALEEVGTIEVFDFVDQEEIDSFAFGGNGIFGEPTESTENGSLSMSINDQTSNFGSFTSVPTAVVANPVGIEGELYVRMKADISSTESNGLLVPDIQLRMTDENNSFEQINMITGIGDADQIPTSGESKTYYTYFPLNSQFQDDLFDVTAIWDAFSVNQFGANGTSSSPISLDRLEFDLIRIPDYPAEDPTFAE